MGTEKVEDDALDDQDGDLAVVEGPRRPAWRFLV
jgi:hypothetical protein